MFALTWLHEFTPCTRPGGRTDLIEVPVVDEETLVVRDGHDTRASVGDLRRVVGDALPDRVGETAAKEWSSQ